MLELECIEGSGKFRRKEYLGEISGGRLYEGEYVSVVCE